MLSFPQYQYRVAYLPYRSRTYRVNQHIEPGKRTKGKTTITTQMTETTTTYKGPAFSLSSNPSLTRASTPTPNTDEFSSFAMNTATTVFLSSGFVSPSLRISCVTSATCPRQSVVPRPRSLSPSTLSEKGSNSYGRKGKKNQIQIGRAHV